MTYHLIKKLQSAFLLDIFRHQQFKKRKKSGYILNIWPWISHMDINENRHSRFSKHRHGNHFNGAHDLENLK